MSEKERKKEKKIWEIRLVSFILFLQEKKIPRQRSWAYFGNKYHAIMPYVASLSRFSCLPTVDKTVLNGTI